MYFERTSSKNLAKLKIEVERMKEMETAERETRAKVLYSLFLDFLSC